MNPKRVKLFDQLARQVRMHDVPGQPTVAAGMAPWLLSAIRAIVCGIHRDDAGVLRSEVSEALLLVSKKNGKSSGTAFLVIAWALMSPRAGCKIALCSAEQQAVDVLFRACAGMIRASPEVADKFNVVDYRKQILCIANGINIEVKAYSAGALQGGLFSLIVLDELSLIGRVPDSTAIYQEASGAISITERVTVMLSTHDTRPPQGLFKAKLTQFREAQANPVPGLLPVMFEAPESVRQMKLDALLADPALLWRTIRDTNPSIGYSIPSLADLQQSFARTVPQGADAVGSWLAKHANIQVLDFLQAESPWIWAEHAPSVMTTSITSWRDVVAGAERIFISADGGGAVDLCGFAVGGVWPGGGLKLWVHSFCFESALADTRITSILQDAVAAGELTVWDQGAELSGLEEIIREILQENSARAVLVLDSGSRANLSTEWAEQFGLPPEQIYRAPRGVATFGGAEELGRRMAAGPARCSMNSADLLRWQFANMVTNARGFIEKASMEKKIDAPMAAVFVTHAMVSAPPPIVAAFTI